jgi:hypothetical protein
MDGQPKTKYNKEDFNQVVEKIDLNNLKKVNHTEHEHAFVRDGEETEDYYAMKCSWPRCWRGYLVKK